MPIRFRCSNCNRLLGIARRKAGATVSCPHCLIPVRVPEPGPDDDDDAIVPSAPAAASARLPAPPSPAPPPLVLDSLPPAPRYNPPAPAAKTVAPVPAPRAPASPPPPARPRIFEQSNIEEILRSEPDSPVLIPQPSAAAATGAAVPENALVLSSSRATILSVLLALLLAIVFAAGVLVGRLIR